MQGCEILNVEQFVNTAYTSSEFAHNLPFFVDGFSHFDANASYFTEREGMESYLLMYTVGGMGRLVYEGGEFLLEPGHAALIDCRNYQYYGTAGTHWEFFWIHFDGTPAAVYYDAAFRQRFFVPYLAGRLKPLFEQLFALPIDYTMTYELQLCSLVGQLLTEVTTAALNEKNEALDSGMGGIASYLMKHYAEPVRLAELAEKAHFSLYHFIRVFKKEIGETPHEFLTRCRINQSKNLLITTPLSVEETAHRVGYGDVNTFIRAFRRLTGTTPYRYRCRSIL